MKALLTLADVRIAIQTLKSQGRKTTLANLHAQLGHRGSMTTLVRLKAEAEALANETAPDRPEALEAFREIWARAMEIGREENRTQLAIANETNQALLAEMEQLEAELVERQREVAELLAQRDQLIRDVAQEREARNEDRQALNRATAELTSLKSGNNRPLLFTAAGDPI